MKPFNKYLPIVALMALVTAESCVKDRLQPAATPPIITPTGDDTLMYYWNFNAKDSSKHGADVSNGGGNAFYTFFAGNSTGTKGYVDFTTGTSINLQGSADSGSCLRLRNPADSVIFRMPTTGFKQVKLMYAEQRTSSGPSINSIYYTTDGTHYVSTALANNQYTIDTVFKQFDFDFSSDSAANNNPAFAVKIVFNNNNTGTSGNDRFDNVSLLGIKK